MPIFQSIHVVNGLSKSITFVQIWKMQFFESFFSFPSEIDNKGQITYFTGSSLTLWTRRATGSDTSGCRGWSCLLCTHVDRACQNYSWFEKNIMKFMKMLALTYTLPLLLRYNRLNLHFLFFFQLPIFKSILVMNGLNKKIALVQKWKNAGVAKFFLI